MGMNTMRTHMMKSKNQLMLCVDRSTMPSIQLVVIGLVR